MNPPVVDFNVAGVEFIVAVLAGGALFFHLPTVRLRQFFLAAANLVVLWANLPGRQAGYVFAAELAFVLSGYLVAGILLRYPSSLLLGAYLTALVAAFLVLKKYEFLEPILPANVLQHPIAIVGLSYMLFRQIHFLVDIAQGQIEQPTLWNYWNYQTNLFTVLAGPIQRYQDFCANWDTLAPLLADVHELLQTLARLFWGVIKIGLLAPFFFRGWDELRPALALGRVHGWICVVEFAAVFYLYPLYLYFNFSGYCDIVIAAARFFGLRLPENFNWPFLARNVIDFWTRWHITLGLWIRDYLFLQMYKPIVERAPKRAPRLAFVCYFLAFLIAGIWHGSTMNFVYYGLWQGIGASCTKLYEMFLLNRLGRQGLRKYLQSTPIRLVAIALNIQFQCVSMMYFSSRDLDGTEKMLWNAAHALVGGYS
jgi:D-alanyl-lipoteichoic acid acyltransferase DltB (MBOAT superfamily)